MYSTDLKCTIGDINDKRHMISLAKTVHHRDRILAETKWLDNLYKDVPLKIRCYCIINDINSVNDIPKCYCGNPVSFDKAYNSGFIQHCSPECSRRKSKIKKTAKNYLDDKEWLYDARNNQKLSYRSIAAAIGSTDFTVIKACKKHGITKSNLLERKDWLYREYVSKYRTMKDIADEVGCSKSTVSVWCKTHGIDAREPNSYDNRIIVSKECQSLIDYIATIIPSDLIQINNRSLLNGKELDVVIPHLNIAFEYNGVYSHVYEHQIGSVNKPVSYHLQKTLDSLDKGIRLYHIFSDDWMLNREVMQNFVAAKLGHFEHRVYARKCEIKTVDTHEKVKFLEHNHLQGKDSSSIQYGLYHENMLVALMTFCKSRYNREATWELSRFCVKGGTMVVGGFSKLLKHFRNHHPGSIVSYADRSYSFGDVYLTNGFTLIKTNPPGYKYVNLNKSIKRLHRSGFTKAKITTADDTRTEYEIMMSKGYKKIFDCGQLTYMLQ